MGTSNKCNLFIKLRSCHLYIDNYMSPLNWSFSGDTHYGLRCPLPKMSKTKGMAAQQVFGELYLWPGLLTSSIVSIYSFQAPSLGWVPRLTFISGPHSYVISREGCVAQTGQKNFVRLINLVLWPFLPTMPYPDC